MTVARARLASSHSHTRMSLTQAAPTRMMARNGVPPLILPGAPIIDHGVIATVPPPPTRVVACTRVMTQALARLAPSPSNTRVSFTRAAPALVMISNGAPPVLILIAPLVDHGGIATVPFTHVVARMQVMTQARARLASFPSQTGVSRTKLVPALVIISHGAPPLFILIPTMFDHGAIASVHQGDQRKSEDAYDSKKDMVHEASSVYRRIAELKPQTQGEFAHPKQPQKEMRGIDLEWFVQTD